MENKDQLILELAIMNSELALRNIIRAAEQALSQIQNIAEKS